MGELWGEVGYKALSRDKSTPVSETIEAASTHKTFFSLPFSTLGHIFQGKVTRVHELWVTGLIIYKVHN